MALSFELVHRAIDASDSELLGAARNVLDPTNHAVAVRRATCKHREDESTCTTKRFHDLDITFFVVSSQRGPVATGLFGAFGHFDYQRIDGATELEDSVDEIGEALGYDLVGRGV